MFSSAQINAEQKNKYERIISDIYLLNNMKIYRLNIRTLQNKTKNIETKLFKNQILML